MLCCFCSAHVDTVEEASGAGWIPSFYQGEQEYEGPVCVPCCEKHIQMGADDEMELKPNIPLPELAIRLRPHPNLL